MKVLPTDPSRRNAVLVAALALAGTFLFHSYIYSPRARKASELQSRVDELQRRSAVAETLAVADGGGLDAQLDSYEAHMTRLEQLLPTPVEVATLLDEISLEERATGVHLLRMQPEPLEQHEFYEHRSYQMTVRGGYHQVGAFISAVGSLNRIVTSGDLLLAPAVTIGDSGQEAELVASFRVAMYVLPERMSSLVDGRPSAAADLIYERDSFVYPVGVRRDPFMHSTSQAVPGWRVTELELLGILYHRDPQYSVALFSDPAGDGIGERWLRLRKGDRFGDHVGVDSIYEHRVVLRLERPAGPIFQTLILPRVGWEGGA